MKQRDLYQVSLKLILKNAEGKILGLQGDPRGTFAGYYDLPGGRIDTDEFKTPLLDILKREVNEELGDFNWTVNELPVAVGRHEITVSSEKSVRVFYVFFEGLFKGGDFKISDEHQGHQWIDVHSEPIEKYFISGLAEGIRMYCARIKK